MVFMLLLIPANLWISLYLSKRGLKIAAVFHSILFCEMLIAAFIVRGGPLRDCVGYYLHLTRVFDGLTVLLGEGARDFIAPFCILETVCYIIVALAFVSSSVEVAETAFRFFKKRILQSIVSILLAFRASTIPARVEKLFRKNCVMRC